VQPGDAEHGVVDAVALEAAAAQDLPVLHAGKGVLDAGADFAVGGVVFFFPGREFGLAAFAAGRDDEAGAPVAAVGDDRGVADPSRIRSSSCRLQGRPLRTGSAPSRLNAVISLPN
jgi:hypothetical protein